jgi:hypothetical protein
MGMLFEAALVLALVVLVGSYLLRGRRQSEQQEIVERRVEAYMQTIRRERSAPALAEMNDTELRDLLLSSARNFKLQTERKWYLLAGGALVALLAAIVVATQDGARGFGIAILIGAVVLYGLNEFIGRRIREPLNARGIDVERLRVE